MINPQKSPLKRIIERKGKHSKGIYFAILCGIWGILAGAVFLTRNSFFWELPNSLKIAILFFSSITVGSGSFFFFKFLLGKIKKNNYIWNTLICLFFISTLVLLIVYYFSLFDQLRSTKNTLVINNISQNIMGGNEIRILEIKAVTENPYRVYHHFCTDAWQKIGEKEFLSNSKDDNPLECYLNLKAGDYIEIVFAEGPGSGVAEIGFENLLFYSPRTSRIFNLNGPIKGEKLIRIDFLTYPRFSFFIIQHAGFLAASLVLIACFVFVLVKGIRSQVITQGFYRKIRDYFSSKKILINAKLSACFEKIILFSSNMQKSILGNKSFHLILLILISIVIALIQIGNFQNRQATAHVDNWPELYSHFYKFPTRYAADNLSTYGFQTVFSTIHNLLPALMFKHLDISPAILDYLSIICQFLLLSLSFRSLSLEIFGSELPGWVSTLIVFGADAYNWNLALYGGIITKPYAGYLVMPLLIYSVTFALKRQYYKTIILLILSSLIHPILTIFVICILGLYEFLSNKQIRFNKFHLMLLFVFVIAILPRLYIQTLFPDTGTALTFNEMVDALKINQHTRIIKLDDLNKRQVIFLFIIPLILFGMGYRRLFSKSYQKLILSVMICCMIFVLAHFIGWHFGILMIIQLIPHRATILLSILALPLIANLLLINITSGSYFRILIAGLFTYFLFIDNQNFINSPWFFLFLFLFLFFTILDNEDVLKGKLIAKIRNLYLNRQIFLEKFLNNLEISKFLCGAFVVCLLLFTLIRSVEIGRVSYTDDAYALFDLQSWASINTPENAMIANMGRIISKRPSFSFDIEASYIYNRSRSTKEFEDRLIGIYKEYFNDSEINVSEVSKMQLDEALIDEELIRLCSKEFGFDYVAMSNTKPLGFSVEYKNNLYTLYKIQ